MDQLAASLVAETGLTPAAAATIAAEVREHARERGFASPAEACAWLRVAARRRALDTLRARTGTEAGGWPEAVEAADQALVRIREAATGALETLPADEREVLRLRYVEGLLPDAIAARLGTTADAVQDRLAAARADAARALRPERFAALRGAARPLAAAFAAAAAALTFVGAPSAPLTGTPRARAADVPPGLLPELAPRPVAEPAGAVERDSRDTGTSGAVRVVPTDVRVDPELPGHDPKRPPCGALQQQASCQGGSFPTPDEIRVVIPGAAREASGERDVVVKQEYVPFSVCSEVPANPASEVATCKPGSHD